MVICTGRRHVQDHVVGESVLQRDGLDLVHAAHKKLRQPAISAGLKRRLRPSSGEIPLAFAQAVTNRIVSSDARTTIAGRGHGG
jgi:hypothetical protein